MFYFSYLTFWQKGITQVQNNTNLFSVMSQQVRINGNLQSVGGAMSSAREITDDFGSICLVETPDNKACGMVKPQALYSRISVDNMNEELIVDLILNMFSIISEEKIFDDPHSINEMDLIHVSVNEKGVGMVTPQVKFQIERFFRSHRYSIAGDSFLSVVNLIETNDLKIYCDGGRLTRALFNAKKFYKFLRRISKEDVRQLWITMSWDMMLDEGLVEFIDKAEENSDCLICMDVNEMFKILQSVPYEKLHTMPFTHCEIKNLNILGLCAASIVWAPQNQGPKLTFATNLSKQSMPGPNSNDDKMDTLKHHLSFNNMGLSFCMPLNWLRKEKEMCGQTIDVGFMCDEGFNQEDAASMNQGYIDRGWGRSIQDSTFGLNANSLHKEIFLKSNCNDALKRKIQSYDQLDDDGLPWESAYLTTGDIIISRVQSIDSNISNFKYTDVGAVTLKKNAGTVKRALITSSLDGVKKVRVTTEKLMKPSKGNKYCLTPEHEVLTSVGWKLCEKITKQDLVATLVDGKKLNYEHPVKIFEYHHSGLMYHLKSDQVELITTQNHRMWVQIQGKNEYEMLNAHHIYHQNVQYLKTCQEMDFKLDSNCVPYIVTMTRQECQEYIAKYYPEHKNELGSKEEAEEVQIICLHAGISADIESSLFNCWKVTIHHHFVPNSNIEENWAHYEGKVWCLEVPSHVFYVRLNGKPVWTANSSRHAQKTTMGIEAAECDIPFSAKTGITPGIIFNPHGLISRMTVANIIEPFAGEVSGIIMERLNATPWDLSIKQTLKAYQKSEEIAMKDYDFLRHSDANCTGNFDLSVVEDNENRIVELSNVLKHHGFNKWAEEEFMNPKTGELIGINGCKGRKAGLIFRGKMFYYVLTHLAEDKCHSRQTGARNMLTMQPNEGGSKGGGYKLGEMEMNCFGNDTRILTNKGFYSLSQIENCSDSSLSYACYDIKSQQIVYGSGRLVLPENPDRELLNFTSLNEQESWSENANYYGTYKKEECKIEDKSNQLSIRVTKNHNMYVQVGTKSSENTEKWVERLGKPAPPKIFRAQDLLDDSKQPFVKFTGCAVNGIQIESDLSHEFFRQLNLTNNTQIEAFVELFGFWLGDGSLSYDNTNLQNCFRVCFSQRKKDDLTWIKQKCLECGLLENIDWYETQENAIKVVNILIKNSCWVDFFHQKNLTRGSKWIPAWVNKLLDKSKLRILVEGLRRAAYGLFKNVENKIIWTSSERFRDELIIVLLHAGYSAFFNVENEPGKIKGYSLQDKIYKPKEFNVIEATTAVYKVCYCEPTSNVGKTFSHPILNTKEVKTEQYDGRIWCVNVDHPDHLIFAQRFEKDDKGQVTKSSRPVIIGNCLVVVGAASFLRERHMKVSDPFDQHLCTYCGNPCEANLKDQIFYCTVCSRSDGCGQTEISKGFNILLNILKSTSLFPRYVCVKVEMQQ